jgi:hypothetical protein
MLKNAGVIDTVLELSSVHPPPSFVSGRVTAPSVGHRTSTPATIDLIVEDDVPTKALRKSNSKLALFAALGVLASAAAVMAWQGHSAPGPALPAAAAPQRGVDLAPAQPAATTKPVSVVDLDLEPPPSASALQSAKGTRPNAKAQAKAAAARAAAATTSAAKRARSSEDELDPGF